MIDRIARDKMAENLRHFISGQITNFDFDNQAISTKDEAVLAIFGTVWCFYDDFKKHKMRGEWALPEDIKKQMARWVLFLYSDAEYEWPQISFAGIRPLKHGFISKIFGGPQRELLFMSSGNYAVWPFISAESFEYAKQNPTLLSSS